MPRKTKAQIEREIAEALATSHHVQLQVPGGIWVYVTASGTGTPSPDHARDFESADAAQAYIDRIRDPRSSVRYRYVTSRKR